MNYVNKELRDLWGDQPCYLRLPGCEGAATCPAHSNQSRHGKGKSIKAHDVFCVPACDHCHRQIDSGKDMSREERYAAWDEAFARWLLVMFQTGLVVVSGQEAKVDRSYTAIPKIYKRPVA